MPLLKDLSDACRSRSIAHFGCKGQLRFTNRVRLACGLFLGICSAASVGDEQTAPMATQQRETATHWLQLEGDRRDYKKAEPAGDLQGSRQQDQQLRQQGLRDTDRLLRNRQSSAVQRQNTRVNSAIDPGPSATGNAAGERQFRSQQLQNRMQRRSWRW